jgi:hypothetical protein
MENKETTLKLLRETFFRMFKTQALPNLEMEDFVAMWQTLSDKWGVIKSDSEWNEFAEEINCVASNREHIFNEIFDKHFNN